MNEYKTTMASTGGFSVRPTSRGWLVERWSTLSGTPTGGRWLVYYSPRFPRGSDLAASAGMVFPEKVAEEIDTVARFADQYPGERVRCLAKPYSVR